MKGKVFTAKEVQAIIAGSKVMFREVVKPQPNKIDTWEKPTRFVAITEEKAYPLVCPYQVGQKIFVKESFGSQIRNYAGGSGRHLVFKVNNPYAIDYTSACGKEFPVKWKPAQHMKQEHSRLTLLIKNIGVERLQKLTFGDALREGASDTFEGSYDGEMLLEKFKSNWNATHKKPEEKFEANPWVFVYSFGITT